MRIVIDRLRDRYGNSGRERDEMGIERERETKEVESCFLSRQIEFLRGGFALTFPSFQRENWRARATVKTETRFRESFSLLSLSLFLS